jgi:hypothetical protein
MLSVFSSLGWANGTHHHTSSYMHPSEVRAYPLHRPGHVRKSGKLMIPTGDSNSKMVSMKMMEHKEVMRMEARGKGLSPLSRPFASDMKCTNNKAGQYSCDKVDMLSFVPIAELGSTREMADCWGWTDPLTKDEIAIVMMEDSTAFVQVTDPYNPVVLGNLHQSADSIRIWADAKVYDNSAWSNCSKHCAGSARSSAPYGSAGKDVSSCGLLCAGSDAGADARAAITPTAAASTPPTAAAANPDPPLDAGISLADCG